MIEDRLTITKNENNVDFTLPYNSDFETQTTSKVISHTRSNLSRTVSIKQYGKVPLEKYYVANSEYPYIAKICGMLPNDYHTSMYNTILIKKQTDWNTHPVAFTLIARNPNVEILNATINRGTASIEEDETTNKIKAKIAFDVANLFEYKDITITIKVKVLSTNRSFDIHIQFKPM